MESAPLPLAARYARHNQSVVLVVLGLTRHLPRETIGLIDRVSNTVCDTVCRISSFELLEALFLGILVNYLDFTSYNFNT